MITGSVGRLAAVLVGFGLICTACSGSSTAAPSTAPKPGSNATVCDPGARRCEGHDILRCDATGGEEVVESTCFSELCRVRAGEPVCPPTTCAANLPTCDGSIATKCKVDGSGPVAGGVDCAASKQSCIEGTCRDVRCVAGTRSCEGNRVYLCAPDGSSLSIVEYCADNQECSDTLGTCIGKICEPNKSTCSGSRVTTCNSSGTNWLPASPDCADDGKACVAGSCEERVCTPSTTYCRDGNLYQCDPTGSSTTLSKTCRPGFEHCEVTPAGLYAFCVADVCTAGYKLCAGDVIKTCNANGSLPAEGIACAKDEYCENAECKPRLCKLGTYYCKDQSVYSCEPNGPQLYTQCGVGEECRALLTDVDESVDPSFYADLVWCVTPSCPPSHADCVLNKVGACAADGSSLSVVTSDCAADGKVCTADLTCASSATDTLGQDEVTGELAEDTFWGTVLDVRSPRKLTEIQQWIAFATTRQLRWMVYELVGSQFVLRVDKTTTEASGAGFVSSGPLSFAYQLEAGKRYALGVAVSGGGSVVVYDEVPFETKASFGDPLGAASTFSEFSSFNVAGGFYRWSTPRMKLTTTAP